MRTWFCVRRLYVGAVRNGVSRASCDNNCAATNAKVQKKTLQLLAQADRQTATGKEVPRYRRGTRFNPTAVQLQNERLWNEAKQAMPAAAAEAEAAPPETRTVHRHFQGAIGDAGEACANSTPSLVL